MESGKETNEGRKLHLQFFGPAKKGCLGGKLSQRRCMFLSQLLQKYATQQAVRLCWERKRCSYIKTHLQSKGRGGAGTGMGTE